MVGTPKNIDAPGDRAASATAVGSKAGSRRADAPANSVPYTPTHRPWAWKTGRQWTSRSSGVQRQAILTASVAANRFRWLSTAPLGAPVVPDV